MSETNPEEVVTHFLQSPAWARFQRELGRNVIERSGDGWHYLAIVERGRASSRLYCPYGPVVTRPGALADALASLREEATALGVIFIRIEPTGLVTADDLAGTGSMAAPSVQPTITQRVRIDRPWEETLADFKATNRNLHRNYAKKGLRVRTSSDPAEIEILLNLLHGVADRNNMNPQSDAYLRTQASTLLPAGDALLYIAEIVHEDAVTPVAASLIFDDGHIRYYAHAAADFEHRKLSPGTVLVSQAMEDATAAGRSEFDLMGVVPPDADPEHPWFGFSTFKRSFGGYQLDYAGTWEIPLKKPLYGLYRMARRIAEKVRR